MAETTDLEFGNLNEVIRFLENHLNGMTWAKAATIVDMDHTVVYKWAKPDDGRGFEKANNLFLIQCLADVLGFELSLRIRSGDKVLLTTRSDREIGRLFKNMRIMKGMTVVEAIGIINGTLDSFQRFETGEKPEDVDDARSLGMDRIQALASALDLQVNAILTKREKPLVRINILKEPFLRPKVRSIAMSRAS